MSDLFYAVLADEMVAVEEAGAEGELLLGSSVMVACAPVWGRAVKAGRSLEMLTVAVYGVAANALDGDELRAGPVDGQFVYGGSIPGSALTLASVRRLYGEQSAVG